MAEQPHSIGSGTGAGAGASPNKPGLTPTPGSGAGSHAAPGGAGTASRPGAGGGSASPGASPGGGAGVPSSPGTGAGSQPSGAGSQSGTVSPNVRDSLDRLERGVKQGDAGSIVNELKSGAGELKTAAVEHGRHLLESAKDQATGFADQRKDDVARSVSDIASSLRESGRQFGERPNIQAFVGSAADGLEQLAAGLRERSFADIYSDVENYARRSPVTVGAVAAVAGFLLARFIKASAEDMADARAASHRRADAMTPPSGTASRPSASAPVQG